jgi:hypothetical protein
MSSIRRPPVAALVGYLLMAGCHGDSGSKVSLSYHPPAGATYHYTLEQHNAMKFENGPMAQMPEQKMTMRMYISQAVTGPTADGVGVTVTFDSTKVESPNLAPGALTAALNQIRGVKTNVVYDARMSVVHSELSAASAMSSPMTDQLTRGVKAMTFQLPDHPVGVGDSWTTETEMPMGQAGSSNTPARATTKLTVKEIHPGADTTVLLGVETTYPTGPISVNQQGQQLTLKVSGNLAGEQLFSLTRGTAVRSSLEGTMRIHITGGTTGPQGMDMAMQQATMLQLNDAK